MGKSTIVECAGRAAHAESVDPLTELLRTSAPGCCIRLWLPKPRRLLPVMRTSAPGGRTLQGRAHWVSTRAGDTGQSWTGERSTTRRRSLRE